MASDRRVSRVPRLVLLGVSASFLGAAGVAAQIPEEFTNLQVLPADIGQRELVGMMRGFAGNLGVRCSYCHTVSDQLNQPDDDFAADDKATKRKARLMLQMVGRINDETLAQLPDRTSPNVSVTCGTCHGGISRPMPIDQEVEHIITGEGVDAALARYGELRERYHGSRAYDFSFRPLNALAERLAGREMVAEAVQVLELNAEHHPTSLPTLLLLGQAHERNGDNEAALTVYHGMVELDPSTRFYDFYAGQAQQRIEAIGDGTG
jgi:hypothetical protein